MLKVPEQDWDDAKIEACDRRTELPLVPIHSVQLLLKSNLNSNLLLGDFTK